MLNPETVQIVIQGGAVGILLVFGAGTYMLVRYGMGMLNTFVSNHLDHILSALVTVEKTLSKLDDTIERLNKRLGERERKK